MMPDVDRVAASKLGVEARQARATLKNKMKQSRSGYRECLEVAWSDSDSVEGRMWLREFLLTLPAVGKVKADRILEELGVSKRRRLSALGSLQRRRLTHFLDGWLYKTGVEK